MGKCLVGALWGVLGAVLFVGCGSAEIGLVVGEGVDEDDGGMSAPSRERDGAAELPDGDVERDAAGDDASQDDDATAPHDAGPDVAMPPPDAGGEPLPDAGPDASDSGPATIFTMPAILKDEWTCWQDTFPNPVCKPVPVTSPPIFEIKCDGIGISMAKIRVPPRSCVRVQGRFESDRLSADACFTRTSCTAQSDICRLRRNETDEEQFAHLHDTGCGPIRAGVNWYPIADCPAPTASCF